MKIKLTNVRGAFLKLWTAETVNGGDKAVFGGSFLLDPTDPQIKMVEDAMLQVAKAKWGAKADAIYKEMKAGGKLALRDGDSKASYDGFEGKKFISATTATRPLTLNRDKSPVTEQDGIIYSGCYVNVSMELWAQDNSWGKRINAQLGGVQFFKDGDSFGGGGSAADEDDFDALDGADADDLV